MQRWVVCYRNKNVFFILIKARSSIINFVEMIFRLQQPCDNCQAPYGFRNHMTLNTNTTLFSVSSSNGSNFFFLFISTFYIIFVLNYLSLVSLYSFTVECLDKWMLYVYVFGG